MWTYGVNNNRQILICNPKANDTQTCLTWNSYPYVANNSTWHTSIFDMKQLSMCGKQQQMTYNHVWHETVIHMWQTTANDTQTFLSWSSCPYVANNSWHTACWTWNSYPYVANNSKWHTIIFDMKHLSICDKQQQMTHKHFDMKQLPYVANNSKWNTSIFDMKQLSICGKQQQMTYNHFWHETLSIWHEWNSYPYVANNSKWHTSMFDMKQLSICGKQQQMTHKHVCHETVIHLWQITANDNTWNSYPYVANNSKWHTRIFDMKQLSMFYLFIYLKFILPFWLAKQ